MIFFGDRTKALRWMKKPGFPLRLSRLPLGMPSDVAVVSSLMVSLELVAMLSNLQLCVFTSLLLILTLERLHWLIYVVEDHIEFIVGDFFQLAPSLKGNVVFLSPPWGGPAYRAKESFTLDLLKPKDGYSLFQVAQSIAPNVIMYLPRNVDLLQVEELSWLSSPPLEVEIEENMLHGRLKSITAYFGDIAFSDLSMSEL